MPDLEVEKTTAVVIGGEGEKLIRVEYTEHANDEGSVCRISTVPDHPASPEVSLNTAQVEQLVSVLNEYIKSQKA